jgi:hypothetical protein
MSLRALFSLSLMPFFLLSFSGVAEACERSNHNSYFHCKHTHRKVERTKACPCGCNKKKRATLRLTADHDSCDSDDVVAHVPQFTKLAGYTTAGLLPRIEKISVNVVISSPPLKAVFHQPPVPPG